MFHRMRFNVFAIYVIKIMPISQVGRFQRKTSRKTSSDLISPSPSM